MTYSAASEARGKREQDFVNVLRGRMLCSQFEDVSGEGEDSGGGSALDSITSAAASLGGAYIAAQSRNNNSFTPQLPRTLYGSGTYGAVAPGTAGQPSLGVIAVIGVIGVALIAGVLFALK